MIYIESAMKDMVAFAIRTEELPVTLEETTSDDITRFVIKRK